MAKGSTALLGPKKWKSGQHPRCACRPQMGIASRRGSSNPKALAAVSLTTSAWASARSVRQGAPLDHAQTHDLDEVAIYLIRPDHPSFRNAHRTRTRARHRHAERLTAAIRLSFSNSVLKARA